MPLGDVTNVPASSSRGRSPGIFLCLPQEYVPTKNTSLDTLPSANKRRAQGEKNVDLWIEGCLYSKDPSLNVHPPFTNIPSLLQYVGNGEQGLLGYCKRLNRHEIARSEIYLRHWQLLNGSFHNLQDQMQTATSALEEAKSTIATKENVIKKLEDTLSHMKSTAMGGTIPPTLENCRYLVGLDLSSSNELKGIIPCDSGIPSICTEMYAQTMA
ncbi:hypothetical protein L7F22_005841 [Adiantum nelumboides]|nr:hypothetical protein [Adiantum nelumboides]